MNHGQTSRNDRLPIPGHLAWFATHSAAISASATTQELLDAAAGAVAELTGLRVIACRNDTERDLALREASGIAQLFAVGAGADTENSVLVVCGPEIPVDQAGAVSALLFIVEPHLQHTLEIEHSERLEWEESVIAKLFELLVSTGDPEGLQAGITQLAKETLSPAAASIAVSATYADTMGPDERQSSAVVADTRLLERFVHTLHLSRNINPVPRVDPTVALHLDALSDVTLAAASTHDLRELYQAVRAAITRVLPADALLIAMIPAGEDEAVTVFRSELETPYFDRTPLVPPFQMAMRFGRPFIIDEIPENLFSPEHRFGDPTRKVRSLAGAPLVSNDRVTGLLVAQCYEPNAYTIEHANLLLDIGRSIAVALERADLLDDLRAQSERETALRTVAERLTTTLNTRELLKIAVAETAPILDHCLIAAISIDAATPPAVTHIAAHGTDGVMDIVGITANSQLDPCGIAAQVAKTQEVAVIEDRDRSIVALPLLAESVCIGTFVIARRKAHVFSGNDLALLGTLCGTLASALRNAELYTNRSQHERDLLEVQRVSQLVSSSLNPEAILKEIITSLPQLFDSEGCSVRMVEDGDLIPLAEYGAIVSTFAPRIPIASSLAGTIIRDKRVLAVNDLHTHPVTGENARGAGIAVRGWLAAPMIDADGAAIGILSIHSDHPRQWSE
ncbi:MAG: GAF domain-containing protein, partial [Chloroflexia bacterium]|nr:GAF domain-containing protein [Chloroflexia bacterium]